MARVINLVIIMLIVLFGLAFQIRNGQLVSLDYYLGSVELPLSWALVISLGSGAVLGLFASLMTIIRLKAKIRNLSKQYEVANRELSNLRAIPVKDVL